jgi:hypothetical protein
MIIRTCGFYLKVEPRNRFENVCLRLVYGISLRSVILTWLTSSKMYFECSGKLKIRKTRNWTVHAYNFSDIVGYILHMHVYMALIESFKLQITSEGLLKSTVN